MSILYKNDSGFIISHEVYINKIYNRVCRIDGNEVGLKINDSLFKIHTPYANSYGQSRKRKTFSVGKESPVIFKEIAKIQSSLSSIIAEARNLEYMVPNISSKDASLNNEAARKISNEFYQESLNWQGKKFHGANSSDVAVVKSLNSENYVFPAQCTFFNYDVLDIENKLDELKNNYDLILLDPPWWNKYIRRKKTKCVEGSYQMMYNEDLKKIPIESLLAPGSLIAVWCTNSQTHLNSLIGEIFPLWGVKYVAKWFWIKVTQYGEPVCSFSDPPGKQPFEQIVFGCSVKESREYSLPEDGKLIVSVPSSIHSHKPPLCEVLSSFIRPNPQCLELFARYLLPNWTSWGYEVLKLQHMNLYCVQQEDMIPENSPVQEAVK